MSWRRTSVEVQTAPIIFDTGSQTAASTSPQRLQWDTCGRRPGKSFFDVCAALVGCGHVSGLLMRLVWPLALADERSYACACPIATHAPKKAKHAPRESVVNVIRANFLVCIAISFEPIP